MTERLKFEGRLVEAKQERRRLAIRINGLVKSIRDNLDPFAPIDDLDTALVAEQAVALAELHIQHQEVVQQIGALKKALGR